MKITYIYHSGYLVEMEDATLLFDYCNGYVPHIRPNHPLFIFSSHKHHDHYNGGIFDFASRHPDTVYILSSDIKIGVPKTLGDKLYRMDANEKVAIPTVKGTVRIKTLSSTDEGVAFVVDYKGKTVYHAGDLHWWSWKGEPDTVNDKMERRFKEEINKIEGMRIDAAFLPLDPRQGDWFWWGFDYFMKTTRTMHAFPMHFWGDSSVIARLKDMDVSKPYRDRVYEVEKEGQEFFLGSFAE